MARLKLQVSRTNAQELIDQAELVVGKLAPEAPATPPLPNMAAKAASLKAKSDAADEANTAYENAKAALVNLKQARDAAVDELRIEHQATISACESEAKGDPVLLSATGYPLAETSTPSSQPPAKVMNLNLTWGDGDGSLDGSHDPVPNASYEVQVTTGDAVNGPYETKLQPKPSSWQLTGLTSGQRIWVRVRALGSKGPGPWSDPATRIVP